MKNQELRKEILKAYKSRLPKMMPKKEGWGISVFTPLLESINVYANEMFENTWGDIESTYKLYLDNVIGKNIDKKVHKRIFKETLFELLKYSYLGRIYKMAKEDLDEEYLEETLSFNTLQGCFESTNKYFEIDYIIHKILFPAILVLNVSEGKADDLNMMINNLENRYGTYPKELFKIAYNMQVENKGKKPRITDELAVIKANDLKNYYSKDQLVDENGFATPFLKAITKTYANHHKKKLKTKSL